MINIDSLLYIIIGTLCSTFIIIGYFKIFLRKNLSHELPVFFFSLLLMMSSLTSKIINGIQIEYQDDISKQVLLNYQIGNFFFYFGLISMLIILLKKIIDLINFKIRN